MVVLVRTCSSIRLFPLYSRLRIFISCLPVSSILRAAWYGRLVREFDVTMANAHQFGGKTTAKNMELRKNRAAIAEVQEMHNKECTIRKYCPYV